MDKPASGYSDKRNMARDIRELMRSGLYRKWCWWASIADAIVATRTKDYPELADRLAVMDNVPTRIVRRAIRDASVRVRTGSSYFIARVTRRKR